MLTSQLDWEGSHQRCRTTRQAGKGPGSLHDMESTYLPSVTHLRSAKATIALQCLSPYRLELAGSDSDFKDKLCASVSNLSPRALDQSHHKRTEYTQRKKRTCFPDSQSNERWTTNDRKDQNSVSELGCVTVCFIAVTQTGCLRVAARAHAECQWCLHLS